MFPAGKEGEPRSLEQSEAAPRGEAETSVEGNNRRSVIQAEM
jgi:hypothetical protein